MEESPDTVAGTRPQCSGPGESWRRVGRLVRGSLGGQLSGLLRVSPVESSPGSYWATVESTFRKRSCRERKKAGFECCVEQGV